MSTSISMCRSMCIFMCIFMCILMSMSMSISIYISMSIPVVLVGGRRRSGGRHLAGALPPPPVTNHPLSSPPEPSSRTCESRSPRSAVAALAPVTHARGRASGRARAPQSQEQGTIPTRRAAPRRPPSLRHAAAGGHCALVQRPSRDVRRGARAEPDLAGQ